MRDNVKNIPYSTFVQDINAGNVSDGYFDKDTFQGHFSRAGGSFSVDLLPDNPFDKANLIALMNVKGVSYKVQKPFISDSVGAMLVSIVLPLGVIFFFWMFFLRQAQSGGN
jgi:ATP-dependent Zn protease